MRLATIQWGILGAAAALGVILLISFRRVPRAARQAAPAVGTVSAPAGAGHPTTLLSGFDYAQTSSGKPKFEVHADRTVGYAQGAGLPSTWYGLETVSLTLFSEEGEPYKVRSDRADYDPRSKAMHLRGNVVLTDHSGMNLRTTKVDYDPARNLLLVPEPVDMVRGELRGHASSAVYDSRASELALAGPVHAEGTAGPFSTLQADRGVYRRTPGEIEMIGHVEGSRGTDRFSSDSLRLHLTGENRIDRAIAQGGVSGAVANSPGGPPQLFSGAAAKLDFDPLGKLDHIVLSGSPAKIGSSAPPPEQAARSIEAPDLELGYETGRLRKARAQGGALLTKEGRDAKGSPLHETIRSATVDAFFAADGSIDTARFAGDVVATSPDAIGRAPSAVFESSGNRLTFFGDKTRDAEVSAPRGKVVARRIDLLSSPSRLSATDSARAFLRPSSENRGLPEFLSSSKKPTRAKADRIELDDGARTASFLGSAALWQDANALFGDKIDLFDKDRSAAADGRVRVVSRSAAPREDSSPQPPTTVTAERMRYQESTRTARFEGNVLATRGVQNAEGSHAECHFNSRNQVERTVLSDHVKFSDPATGRRGSGDRADDEPLAGVTTLFGDPAVALDAQGNRVSAAVLTFRKDSGSVEARAKDGQKIESIYQTHGSSRGQAHRRMN